MAGGVQSSSSCTGPPEEEDVAIQVLDLEAPKTFVGVGQFRPQLGPQAWGARFGEDSPKSICFSFGVSSS